MAYISAEDAKVIRDELKAKFPTKAGWKFSVRRHRSSSLNVTIISAPYDMLADRDAHPVRDEQYGVTQEIRDRRFCSVNQNHLDNSWQGRTLEDLRVIMEIINRKNWDRSDIQSDYFDVGFYLSVSIGDWDKPFQCPEDEQRAAA